MSTSNKQTSFVGKNVTIEDDQAEQIRGSGLSNINE